MRVVSSPTAHERAAIPLGLGEITLAGCAVVAVTGLSVAAAATGLWKLMTIALVSFGSMVIGAALGMHGSTRAKGLIWAYGLAAGAMVASSAAFLLPVAIGRDPQIGGFGIAAGLLTGFALHSLGERLGEHCDTLDDTVVRLTMHAVAAGIVIGAIYTSLPTIGLLLGLSIVSHKGPAGYAAAHRLHQAGRSILPLTLPAAGVGVPAVVLGLLDVTVLEQVSAMVFGFAAGIFLHVALDFLPSTDTQADQPQQTWHATASALAGAGAVVIAWALVSG